MSPQHAHGTAEPSESLPKPFTIDVRDEVLRDLNQRIRNTRWPSQVTGVGWDQGTNVDYLRELLDYWAGGYDWRSQERDINRYHHFMTTVDGTAIHLVHEKAKDGNGIPIVLTHGWPSTFLEYLPIVDMLTDPASHDIDGPSFDVVIPSLPGYGFSDRPDRIGVTYRQVARMWHELMHQLGYDRYVAAGGDFGSGISTYMALTNPDPLLGIHLTHLEIQPYSGPGSRHINASEREYLAQNERWWSDEGGYFQIQATKPQTLSYGLNDSPAGLAAWIVEKWRSWADTGGKIESRFSADFLLTTLTIYWATQSIATSIRDYADNRPWFDHDPAYLPGRHERIETPVAFTTWPAYAHTEGIPPREWVERSYNVCSWTDMPSGGHFPAVEEPRLLALDIARSAKLFEETGGSAE